MANGVCRQTETQSFSSCAGIPDPYRMLDGTVITDPSEWGKRRDEIRSLYETCMYGVWRDGSKESIQYERKENRVTLFLRRTDTGAEASFDVLVQMPDESCRKPEHGYPVIVGMHAHISEETANAKGFATIVMDGFGIPVASDDTKREGAFYKLYPYGENGDEQTGVLMAWAWGCSKIMDALEQGLADELGIDPSVSVVTGVSRWGKAAMVCGAFDKRFRICAPSCSGAGGVAMYRYRSEGRTYNFESKGASAAYTYSQNEPLSCLQSDGERGWFCDRFTEFETPEQLPVDQHMLCSLTADPNRHLLIIGSCISEDWVNAPAMWYTYLAARNIFRFLGVEDNLNITIHREGHAVIPEDVECLASYVQSRIYHEAAENNLDDLKTSVFALPENHDPDMDHAADLWAHR